MATMLKPGAVVAMLLAGLLAACSSGAPAQPKADIGTVTALKSTFGPHFTVSEVAKTGIAHQLLACQKLPDGLTFDPPSCANYAT